MTAIKGRGSPTNSESTRFSLPRREADGEWLDYLQEDEEEAVSPLRTTITQDHARTIITRNSSPDVGFEQSINAYRGCDHPSNSYATRRGYSGATCLKFSLQGKIVLVTHFTHFFFGEWALLNLMIGPISPQRRRHIVAFNDPDVNFTSNSNAHLGLLPTGMIANLVFINQ